MNPGGHLTHLTKGTINFMRNFFVLTGAGVALLLFGTVARGGEGGGAIRHKSWTEYSQPEESRDFTLDRAVLTALKQNPTILIAIQEIERSKGVIIQIRAQALPQVNASSAGSWTDPNLGSGGLVSGTGGGGGNLPGGSAWAYATSRSLGSK